MTAPIYKGIPIDPDMLLGEEHLGEILGEASHDAATASREGTMKQYLSFCIWSVTFLFFGIVTIFQIDFYSTVEDFIFWGFTSFCFFAVSSFCGMAAMETYPK